MKFLGVSGVFDYAGLSGCSRYRACSCCLPHITRASASGLTVYGAEYPPRLSSVYASLSTSRYPAQDSRPSGSLLLSRKALSSSASCRFIPAHCNGLVLNNQFPTLRMSVAELWGLASQIPCSPPVGLGSPSKQVKSCRLIGLVFIYVFSSLSVMSSILFTSSESPNIINNGSQQGM